MRRFAPTKALQFNGTNEYFSLGTGFNFTDGAGTDQPFSVTGWFFFPDATSRGLISKRAVWEFALNPSDQAVVNIYTTGAIYIGRTTAALTSLQNRWVHLAMTYSGSETNAGVKIYVNGAQADTADSFAGAYTGMPSNTTTVTLGALDSSLRWFGGYMGRVVVWNKELSLAEVKEDMVIEDLNFHSAKSNIRNWYDPETYDGTTLKDRKGGVNGTDTNMDSTNLVVGNSYPRRWQTRGDGETPFARFGGLAWNFDGVNEHISLGNILNPTTNSFSWGIWFNNSANLTSNCGMIHKGDGTLQFGLVMDSNENVVAQIRQDGGNYRVLWSTKTFTDGCWHHAMMTFDNSTDTVALYIDGVVDTGSSSITAGTIGSLTNANNLHVGYAQFFGAGAGGSYFNGKLADPICFSRVLTATEVSQIYNAGQPRDETKTNIGTIAGYWRPYNSSAGSGGVLDQSGSANNGTLTNTETTDTQGGYRNYPVKVYDNANRAAFNFGGTNEYASNTSFTTDGSTNITISAWFRTTMSGANGYIFSLPEASGGTNGFDFYINSTGQLRGSINTTSYSDINVGTAASYNNGQWHLATLTYDGANAYLYANGSQYLSIAKTGGLSTAANEVNISRFGSFGAYYIGRINHACVLNRALTAIEVEEMYNQGTPPDLTKVSFASAVTNWWKFNNNDSSTGTINDEISSSDLTASNMEAGDKETTEYPT